MKKTATIAAAALFTLICFASAASAAARGLDGKTYAITVKGPDGKADADKLVFARGVLTSTMCLKYGFKGQSYSATSAGKALSFTMQHSSDKYGSAVWVGTVSGGRISGTMIWTQGGKSTRYSFSGSLKR